jgi:hypothetical protein
VVVVVVMMMSVRIPQNHGYQTANGITFFFFFFLPNNVFAGTPTCASI